MNEHDENDLPHDERHERLCAYLFGELESAERAAFEAELKDDPRLKAELDRMEATVGLVSNHGGGALALSAGAAAELAEKVQAAQPALVIQMAWYRKPWLKVAAAMVLLTGAGLALNELGVFGEAGSKVRLGLFELGDMGHTADAPAAQAPSRAPRTQESMRMLPSSRKAELERSKREAAGASEQRFLGYVDAEASEVGNEVALREQLKHTATLEAEAPEEAAPVIDDPRLVDLLTGFGYSDGGGAPSAKAGALGQERLRGRLDGRAQDAQPGTLDPNPAPAEPVLTELDSAIGLGGGAGGGPGASAGRPAGPGSAPAAGSIVVRRAAGPSSPAASSRVAGIRAGEPAGPSTEGLSAKGGGQYKGAGDLVPPSGNAGEVSLGLRASTSTQTGTTDFFFDASADQGLPEGWIALDLDVAGQQQIQELRVFYATNKQTSTFLDALRLLDDLSVDEGGSSELFFSQPLLERSVTFDSDAGDIDPVLLGGLWAAQDPTFLQLEQKRMEAAGLDRTGWVQMLKQFEYLPQDFEGAFDDPATQIARFHLLEPVLREQRLNELLLDIQRRPGETLDLFYYRHWGTRPVQRTADDPQSTFSADVDTASYALARKMLIQGVFPTRDQIRVEEFVNYFDAGLPNPGQGAAGDANFALSAELAPAPFGPSDEPTWLLRVGAKAREVDQSQRSPLNLTFVVDTSGSMDKENRKDLVKGALRLLVNQLDSRDTISIVRFAKDASTLIEPTPANQRGRILAAIELLGADGGTNVEAGLLHGYNVAATAFDADKVNRVVFLSDGVGNIGETDQDRILDQATDQRSLGIYLNTIGVGLENHNDVFLEQLADNGDGLCNYVGDAIEARKALVENFTGAFEPVARDVKLQVTFDPARVGKYRLLGYENRAIADRDFTNAKVDAAELNAGHEVVALYELQQVQFDGEAPLGTFKLRYKAPFGDEQHMDELERDAETELGLTLSGSLSQFDWRSASLGYQRGALAAQVAEVLRRSGHAKGDDFDGLVAEIQRVADASTDADFREFAGLIERNQAAIAALAPEPSEAQDLLDQLKYAQYELELERSAEGEPNAAKIAAKEAAVEALEQKLRDLVLVGLAQTEETLESPAGAPAPEDALERIGYVDDSEEG